MIGILRVTILTSPFYRLLSDQDVVCRFHNEIDAIVLYG